MRLGRVSQNVYKRSIWKQFHTENEEALTSPSQEERCVGIRAMDGTQILHATVSLYGNEKDLCAFAIAQAVNDLTAKGAVAKGISIELMLPEYAYESRVKSMIAHATAAAEAHALSILRADAQILADISTTIVHVTAIGVQSEAKQSALGNPEPDLVMTGYAGLEGALRIRRTKEEELATHFPTSFLDKLESFRMSLWTKEIRSVVGDHVPYKAMQITEGGIFAALWYLAESMNAGLSVDLRKIPVKQEVIEICECFQLNPYQLTSGGALLFAVDRGEAFAEMLEKEGIPAVVIGRLTTGNDRVLYSGGEMRYLDKPGADELTKLIGM